MTDVDPARFPRVARYLAQLPDGLASYPACTAKTSIYLAALEDHPVKPRPGTLPAALESLLVDRTAPGLRVSEVVNNALHLAIADAHFASSDDDFVAYAYAANKRLFESRLYRVLMWVASPRMVLKGAHSRWYSFHKGTDISLKHTAHSANITLTYPPRLHDGLMLRCFAVAFKAAAEAGNGKDVRFDLSRDHDTRAEYEGTWK